MDSQPELPKIYLQSKIVRIHRYVLFSPLAQTNFKQHQYPSVVSAIYVQNGTEIGDVWRSAFPLKIVNALADALLLFSSAILYIFSLDLCVS